MSDIDHFDWSDSSVVVGHQAPIAVYRDQDGEIVIRQDRTWLKMDDACIVLRPENACALADAILAEARLELPAPAIPAPANRSEIQD